MSQALTEPAHVFHILRTLGGGGMERTARRVIHALAKTGMRHSIALINDERDVLEFDPAITIHRIIPRRRDPRTMIDLAGLLHREQPTVIHVRNLSIWPEAAAARRWALPNVPLILSYHGTEKRERSAPLARLANNTLAREASQIFAVSEGARRDSSELFGLPLEKIRVIPNGVDAVRFSPRAQDERPRGRRLKIGTVGRLFPIKNIGLLLRSAAEIIARGVDAEVHVAGLGPERELLEAAARELGISDRFHLVGRVDDVPAFLRELDIFVLPSDLEASPNALLEAMSVGLPCIATSVGGVPEMLKWGEAGVLIPAGDEGELARVLAHLAGDENLRRALGARAREYVIDRYRETAMFDAYQALYSGSPADQPRPKRAKVAYQIVRAEESDEENIVRLLERYVIPHGAARRYQWLYRENPQGPAVTWLAIDPRVGDIVGFTSIFTRMFRVNGYEKIGSVGLDAFVRPDHRRRGIVAELHHATREAMRRREIPHQLMCGPPVEANLQALLKIGSQLAGSATYLHLPLTPRGLATMIPGRDTSRELFERIAGSLDDLVRRAAEEFPSKLRVRPVQSMPAEADRLWAEHAAGPGIIGKRDASFVRWRYLENPVAEQEVVVVEEHDHLLAWAVFEKGPRGWLLVDDLLPLDPVEAARALRALLAYAVRGGACRMSLFTHADAHSNGVFRNHGFLRGRVQSAFQVLQAAPSPELLEAKVWYLRAGDLDPESCRWSIGATPQQWTDPNYRSEEPCPPEQVVMRRKVLREEPLPAVARASAAGPTAAAPASAASVVPTTLPPAPAP